jgi:hypothetical protein
MPRSRRVDEPIITPSHHPRAPAPSAWLWLRLPIIHIPIKLHADNTSAQSLAYKPSTRARLGHIDAAMHFQREKVEEGLVGIIYVASQDCVADRFTKPLNGVKFSRFRELLRLS